MQHVPVLLQEVLHHLAIRPAGLYLDATFGRGGHSQAILEQLGPTGRLLAFDHDPEAVKNAKKQWRNDPRFTIFGERFDAMEKVIGKAHLSGQVDGVLFDLGVSSPQLDAPERGFSFQKNGPLDMRMDTRREKTAASWLAKATIQEMTNIFRTYGEERFAGRIAKAIVRARQTSPLTETAPLAEVIAQAHPAWEKGKHPATRCFQAIRIYINQELETLEVALQQTLQILAPGGRLAVIGFHSLEHRAVKRFLQSHSRADAGLPRGLPIPTADRRPALRIVAKSVCPQVGEINSNPRARSAVLRVAERLGK